MEDMRQSGTRPNKPSYEDVPLLTPGNPVRVKLDAGLRKATIDCVNDAEGTVDVSLDGPTEGDARGEIEVTVPASAVRRLEAFEVGSQEERRKAFDGDFYAAVAAAKEDANTVFKLGDMHAAMEYYTQAIDELRRFQALEPGEDCQALLNQDGALVLGRVRTVDLRSRLACVVPAAGGEPRTVSWRALIRIHREHLVLQGSLYMNRARCLTQAGRQQEAAQDLSLVVSLWTASRPAEAPPRGLPERLEQLAKVPVEGREQLTKAYYLRAKTRLSRMRIEPARSDAREAWALEPPEATAKLLRQLDREIDTAKKEILRSNKKIAKEIAKFADAAMSNLDAAQLEGLGQGSG
mmetsp:Transcript_4490/g.9124  ORF Transcript_4490/g.9124 Transcript_4490/m.9124 type:complete len:350 (+) Transcript_4490:1-1050(+)